MGEGKQCYYNVLSFLCSNFIYVSGMEVLWYIGVFTRLSRWEPGFESPHLHALLSFSKAIYPHCCSRPRCINGDPVGYDRWLCLNLSAPLSQAAIPGKECSPGSGNCALKGIRVKSLNDVQLAIFRPWALWIIVGLPHMHGFFISWYHFKENRWCFQKIHTYVYFLWIFYQLGALESQK